MSDCKYAGRGNPRVLPGRHVEVCTTNGCPGCQPCDKAHCDVCGHQHVDHAGNGCPECVAATREEIAEIRRMYATLPAEVLHRGVNSDAMALLGPVADPESREHRDASAKAGRVEALWTDGSDDLHPLWVLGTEAMTWRAELGHEEPAGVATVDGEAGYLDRHLTKIAAAEWLEFGPTAKRIRQCVAHLEQVLHDGEQVDRTRVPCLDCGTLLVKRYATQADSDRHVCPRGKCGRKYDDGEFARAKAEHLTSEGADRFVMVSDAAEAIGRSERTVRTWIARGVVQARREDATGRLMAWWPDVREAHVARKVRELQRKAG